VTGSAVTARLTACERCCETFSRPVISAVIARPPPMPKGHFYEPTVVSNVPKDARAMNEEPFGPLALISRFSTLDEVTEEANRLPYGLASYAFTSSTKTATAIGAAIESGWSRSTVLGWHCLKCRSAG
jgi:acyl-CoA reductase-like NAD-dependent aldehyde dehydrogenase